MNKQFDTSKICDHQDISPLNTFPMDLVVNALSGTL